MLKLLPAHVGVPVRKPFTTRNSQSQDWRTKAGVQPCSCEDGDVELVVFGDMRGMRWG